MRLRVARKVTKVPWHLLHPRRGWKRRAWLRKLYRWSTYAEACRKLR